MEAVAKRQSTGATSTQTEAACSSCKKTLPTSNFNRTQLKKDKARCRKCVEKSVEQEEQSRKSTRQSKIDDIQQNIRKAEKSGNVQEKLKYESQLSAMEAENVTGLKPIVMGRGRGSWRGRGRGRGKR